MKTKLFTFAIASFFLFTSCSVLKTSTVKTMDIYGAGVQHMPVVVDLDVNETEVTGTATGDSFETVKQDAVANALKKANADVLIEPKFETRTSSGTTTATVIGFPATYKNFRSITKEDVELLRVGVTQKAEEFEPKKLSRKDRRSK